MVQVEIFFLVEGIDMKTQLMEHGLKAATMAQKIILTVALAMTLVMPVVSILLQQVLISVSYARKVI